MAHVDLFSTRSVRTPTPAPMRTRSRLLMDLVVGWRRILETTDILPAMRGEPLSPRTAAALVRLQQPPSSAPARKTALAVCLMCWRVVRRRGSRGRWWLCTRLSPSSTGRSSRRSAISSARSGGRRWLSSRPWRSGSRLGRCRRPRHGRGDRWREASGTRRGDDRSARPLAAAAVVRQRSAARSGSSTRHSP